MKSTFGQVELIGGLRITAQLSGDLKKLKAARPKQLNNRYGANLTRRLDVAFFVRAIFATFFNDAMMRICKIAYSALFIH
jgi:hypothetical protein